jgi:hypothetical protein
MTFAEIIVFIGLVFLAFKIMGPISKRLEHRLYKMLKKTTPSKKEDIEVKIISKKE